MDEPCGVMWRGAAVVHRHFTTGAKTAASDCFIESMTLVHER